MYYNIEIYDVSNLIYDNICNHCMRKDKSYEVFLATSLTDL